MFVFEISSVGTSRSLFVLYIFTFIFSFVEEELKYASFQQISQINYGVSISSHQTFLSDNSHTVRMIRTLSLTGCS